VISKELHRTIDAAVGSGSIGIGSAGLTLQFMQNTMSLTLMVVNIALALGGMYLLYLRIRKARRDLDE